MQVHYNSDKPAGLQAHAYAQGTDIHLAPGQEKHLPHEAWHVVQQKQGRVKPTMQLQENVKVNDDKGLEKEADVMGQKALQLVVNRKETDSLITVQNVKHVNQLKTPGTWRIIVHQNPFRWEGENIMKEENSICTIKLRTRLKRKILTCPTLVRKLQDLQRKDLGHDTANLTKKIRLESKL